MNLDAFEKRLSSDETTVAKDESRLQRDTSREEAFAAKLGVGPDMRLAQNDAGAELAGAGQPPQPHPAEMRDWGGPKIGGITDSSGPVNVVQSPAEREATAWTRLGGKGPYNPNYAPRPGGPQLEPSAGLDPSPIAPSDFGPGAGIPAPVAPGAPPAAAGQMTLSQPTYRPPTTVGAHWDASRIPDKPGTRQAAFRDIHEMGAAQQHGMEAERRQNLIVANNMQKQNDDMEDMLAHRRAAEDNRQRIVGEKRAVLDKRLSEVPLEDPARVWHNADTGTKIALGIGAFFGDLIPGVGSLMKMMGGSIDSDVAAQRQNIKTKQWGVEQARNQLNDVQGDMHDQRQQELADEASRWTLGQQQIKALIARTSDPIMKARGEEALAATGAQITSLRQQYDRISHVNSYTVGGGAGKPADAQMLIRMPDGSTRVAPTKESYHDATKAIGFTQNIRSNIDKALAIRKAAGPLDLANPFSAASKKLQSLQADTEQLVTVRRGQGAMSKGDEAVAKGAIGTFDSFWNGEANEAVMRGASEREGQHLEGDVNALGAERVDPGYVYDKHGRLVPDSEYVGAADKPAAGRPKSGKPIGQ